MTSLLKNQIIKHLTKFFKNLSPDSLNLSTLRGQCALNNLELNEVVLMEMLELPCWLNLKKAVCNRVFLHVPWLNLKSQPIQFVLDQVCIEVETCEQFRNTQNGTNRNLSMLSSGKYGFTDKVIDGIRIKIDSLEVNFVSPAFKAQFSLLQILIESRLPNFKPVDNISQTKIKDTQRKQILLFKYVEWSSLRFEARSEHFRLSSPLRLITRNGSCKITLKKSLTDCSTIAAKLILTFDDLLWILTDTTLLSAIHLLKYITQLMDKAPLTKKNFQNGSNTNTANNTPNRTSSSTIKNAFTATKEVTSIGQLFSRYDVIESSFHAVVHRLQLHLSDDLHRSQYEPLQKGGGLHVVLSRIVLDLYPYHQVLGSRQHWFRYNQPSNNLEAFIDEHFTAFLTRQNAELNYLFDDGDRRSSYMHHKLSDLLSLTILLRVGDYKVNCVSTSASESRRSGKFRDESDDRVLLQTSTFPSDLPAIYVEMSQFFYNEPGLNRASLRKQAPDPITYAHISPCCLLFDQATFLWANAFYASLHKSLIMSRKLFESNDQLNVHTLIECILPTLTVDLKNFFLDADEAEKISSSCGYESIEIKSTRITFSNSVKPGQNLKNLNDLLFRMGVSDLFCHRTQYPWARDDLTPLSPQFMAELEKMNAIQNGLCYSNQIWTLNCKPLWVDFKAINTTNRSSPNSRSESFLEPFDLSVWIYTADSLFDNSRFESVQDREMLDLCALVCLPGLKLAANHYNYLFLMRLLERFEAFSKILSTDAQLISQKQTDNKEEDALDYQAPLPPRISVCTVLPRLEVFVKLFEHYDDTSRQVSLQPSPTDSPIDLPSETNDSLQQFSTAGDQDSVSFCPSLQSGNESSLMMAGEERRNTIISVNSSEQIQFRQLEIFGNGPIPIFSPNEDDNRSIRSDLSAESEMVFTLEENEEQSFFRSASALLTGEPVEAVEEAVEMLEGNLDDNPNSQANDNELVLCHLDPTWIDYLKLTLNNVSLVKQEQKAHSSLLINVRDFQLEPYEKRPYDEFRFHYRSSGIVSNCDDSVHQAFVANNGNNANESTSNQCIDARLEVVVETNTELLTAKLSNLTHLAIQADLLPKLSDFLLDSELQKISPVHLLFDHSNIRLLDPKLKTPPINLNLSQTILTRNCNNEITFTSVPNAPEGVISLLDSHFRLKRSSEQLSNQKNSLNHMRPDDQDDNGRKDNQALISEIEALRLENERLRALIPNSRH